MAQQAGRGRSRREEWVVGAVAALRAGGPTVSMEAIAAAVGTTKPGLYRVFGSKQGLYDAVANWFIDDLLGDVLRLADPDVPLRAFVDRAMHLVMERVHADRSVYRFLMRRSRMELASRDRSGDDYLRLLGDRVAAIVRAKLEDSGADPSVAPVVGHGIVGLVNSVADWSLDHPELAPARVEGIAARLLNDGVRAFEAD